MEDAGSTERHAGWRLPRVPGYAWAWFQRSRPVVAEAARRLTGRGPSPGFTEDLRASFGGDPFLQAVVADVVAEVAFKGRIPDRRPPGASWDRGLSWWAAALSGVSAAEFEARSSTPAPAQRDLFGQVDQLAPPPSPPRRVMTRAPGSGERAALASALRDLLAQADGGQVPVAALRQLLAHLEEGGRPPS